MPIKTILFDFMGTCLDWHTPIISTLPPSIPESIRSSFALEWRQAYFEATATRVSESLPPEDIDITHARTFELVLRREQFADLREVLGEEGVKERCVRAWHEQPAWPDVNSAIEKLRKKGYEVVVHANGTTRLQLDLCHSSGLKFDMLLSSQLLGVYKPAPENYFKALEVLGRKAEECVLVAAHAYDCRGARGVGMKTVYVYRWTDDVREDQEVVKKENEAWMEDMDGLIEVIEQL